MTRRLCKALPHTLGLAIWLSLAGCSVVLGLDDVRWADLDASVASDSDSGLDAPVGSVCADHVARYIDLRDLEPAMPLVLDEEMGTYTYDTDVGRLYGPQGNIPHTRLDVPVMVPEPTEVLIVDSLFIGHMSTLRVQGEKPLIIASHTNVRIEGLLDLGSVDGWNAAGHDPDACDGHAADEGTDDMGGASGGGGGSYQGAGGAGGTGDSNDGPGTAGGAGGTDVDFPDGVLGGCPGARGGSGNIPEHAPGGVGGGAIYLAACGVIVINGTIHAGGAGGRTGTQDGGGGGGGSGGFIGLDAPSITLTSSAVLAANGGGGGGGGEDSDEIGAHGEHGSMGTNQAQGGHAPGGNRQGGDGGAMSDMDGSSGDTNRRGAGGGGGGAGFIAILFSSMDIDPAAVISPPYVQLPGTPVP